MPLGFRDCVRVLTRKEVIAVAIIVLLLGAILAPALQAAREAARRTSCISYMKQMGIALHNYHDARGMFPASGNQPGHSGVDLNLVRPGSKDTDTSAWSWMANLEPYYGKWLSRDRGLKRSPFVEDNSVDGVQIAAVPFPYRCPSYSGYSYSTFATTGPAYGSEGASVGNYKAIGATTKARLFGSEPDGVINPRVPRVFKDMKDGTSNTIIVCESIESGYGAWIDGATAAVYAFGPEDIDLDAETVEVEALQSECRIPDTVLDPVKQQVTKRMMKLIPDSNTTVHVTIQLNVDTPLPHMTDPFRQGVNWNWGPSSYHIAVVNHLFGDGSARGITRDIDRNLYYGLVTPAGGENIGRFFND